MILHQIEELIQLFSPANEGGDTSWNVNFADFNCPRRWEIVGKAFYDQLIDAFGAIEPFQPVLADVTNPNTVRERPFTQNPCRIRKEDLATVGSRCNSSRTVDVRANVVIAATTAPTAVKTHTNPNIPVLWPDSTPDRPLRFDRRIHRRRSIAVYHQKTIAFGTPFNTTGSVEDPA